VGVDRGDAINLVFLGFLDFILTAEGMGLGIREFNLFYNLFGVWVYPVIFVMALVIIHFLDNLARRFRAVIHPSRVAGLILVLAVTNNILVLTGYG
jgi:hypothetical protein